MSERPDDSEFTEVPLAPAPTEEPNNAQEDPEEPSGEPADEPEAPAEPEEPEKEPPLRDEKGKFKGGAQARFDELTRLRYDAERRASKLEAELEEIRSGKSAPKPKPAAENYDDYGKFIEDLTDWKVEQRDAARRTEDTKSRAEIDAAVRAENWADRVSTVRSTIPDFGEVVDKSEVMAAPHVVDAMLEAEKGPELLYHFAQNPDVVAKLNRMSPAAAALEMGRLETNLSAAKEAPKPRTTTAPAPATPVRGGGQSGKVNLADADMDTYIAERRKQGASY